MGGRGEREATGSQELASSGEGGPTRVLSPSTMATKRAADTALVATPSESSKRPNNAGALVAADVRDGAVVAAGPARTSELLAPIMLLTGHAGAVLSSKFSPDGQHVMTASHDKTMLLWEVFGECANVMNFKGHANAVLDVHWAANGEYAFSCSADKTAAFWDAKTGARIRQFKGHTAVVNSICPSRDSTVLASASDDKSARIWDSRVRTCQHSISHPFPVTATSVGHDGMSVFTGCLDGKVRSYDLRRPEAVQLELAGHEDIVSASPHTHCPCASLSTLIAIWRGPRSLHPSPIVRHLTGDQPSPLT